MALHDRLFNEVRTSCPGVIDSAIEQALWETLDDACRDAWVWREGIEIPLVVGEDVYPVEVPGAEIVAGINIMHPTMDVGNVIWDDSSEALIMAGSVPTANDVSNGPVIFLAALTPSLPSGSDAVDLNPVSSNIDEWIRDDLWNTLHQTLCCGVKERLMGQPAKPYANAQMAAYWHRCYRSHKAIEKRRAYVSNQRNLQTWVFPPFFVSSRR